MRRERNPIQMLNCVLICALTVSTAGLLGCGSSPKRGMKADLLQWSPTLTNHARSDGVQLDVQTNNNVSKTNLGQKALLSELRNTIQRNASSIDKIDQVAFQQENQDSNGNLIPLTVNDEEASANEPIILAEEQATLPIPSWTPTSLELQTGNAVTLEQLEQLLLATHPAILKAQSQLAALSGKKLQASLRPNPNIGVIADDINAADGAGRYGVFTSQQVVRGGKLELAQSVVCSEIEVAKNQMDSTKRQLLIDLRQRYYNVLLAQESVRQTKELAKVIEQSVEASQQLFDAAEIAKAPLLRSEVELQNVKMMVRQANNQRTATLRRLAALVGESEIKFTELAGDVRDIAPMSDFESAFDQMLQNHPELAATLSNIEKARRELAKQRATPIPNVTWQTNVQYDFTTDEIVGGFQVGFPLPKYNRNQGAIMQATQNIQTAVHSADQKVLELRDRLNAAWANYVDATIQLEAFDSQLLPKAEEALNLASEGYRQGETPFLELLSAQQLFAKTKLGYLNKLGRRWQYHVAIQGLISNSGSAANNVAPLAESQAIPAYN